MLPVEFLLWSFMERLHTTTPDSWSHDMTAAVKSCTDDEHGSKRHFPQVGFWMV